MRRAAGKKAVGQGDPLIEAAGRFSMALGLGRAIGRVYAHLYLSDEPRTLDEMCQALRISKGSACMVVRQLRHWDAVRKTRRPRDRRDFYEANDWFGRILRNIAADILGRRLSAQRTVWQRDLSRRSSSALRRERVAHALAFHDKLTAIASDPLVREMLR